MIKNLQEGNYFRLLDARSDQLRVKKRGRKDKGVRGRPADGRPSARSLLSQVIDTGMCRLLIS